MEIVKDEVEKKKVLVVPCDFQGCGYYRIIEPYATIISDIDFEFNQTPELITDHTLNYDAVILQRPCMGEIDNFIRFYQSKGKKVVVEVDDDLLNIPKDNPMHDFMLPLKKTFKKCLELADAIHVSTDQVKQSMGTSLHHKISVFPNAIDLNKYPPKQEGNFITWAGGTSHAESLAIIIPVLKELIAMKQPVLLAGNKEWLNAGGFIEGEFLKIAPWKPFVEQHHLHMFTKINLAPLVDTKFNNCKSELRAMEAAVYGIPTVASDVGPYKRFNAHMGASLLVKNKFQDWMKAIEKLLSDDILYKQKQNACIETIKEYYDLKDVNKVRDSFWRGFLFN